MVTEKKAKTFVGEVVSDKMQKTIVVKVSRTTKDPRFDKILIVSKRYKVHDEEQKAKVGDKVEFQECRPLSKDKYMTLTKIIEQANS